MDLQLKGKRAFISGSTAGIGFATALALINEGVHVTINGRSKASVDTAIARLKKATNKHHIGGIAADFSAVSDIEHLFSTIEPPDILINNVGIYKAGSFYDMSDADWQGQFEINVMSGVRLSRFYLPKMLSRNTGRIIFVSSECAELAPPDMLAYSVSKAAMLALSKGLSQLTKGTAVTVNTIVPGSTLSEGAERFLENEAAKSKKTKEAVEAEFFKEVRTSSLLQRFASVDEVASTITYYCSPLTAATNGAAIRVDGGSMGGLL